MNTYPGCGTADFFAEVEDKLVQLDSYTPAVVPTQGEGCFVSFMSTTVFVLI